MLEFKKSDCSCIICGNKDVRNEEMNIKRDHGNNLIAFTICPECQARMGYELDNHNKGYDKN